MRKAKLGTTAVMAVLVVILALAIFYAFAGLAVPGVAVPESGCSSACCFRSSSAPASWRCCSTAAGEATTSRRISRTTPATIPGRNRFNVLRTLDGGRGPRKMPSASPSMKTAGPGGGIVKEVFAGVAAFAVLTGGGVFLQ